MRRFAAATIVVAVLGALVSPVSALSPPREPDAAVVANPGPVRITFTGGELSLSSLDVPLPICDESGICPSIGAELDAAGRLVIDDGAVNLPAIDVPLGDLGVPVGLTVVPFLRPTPGSVVAPAGQLVRLGFEFGARVSVDVSSLGLGSLLGGIDLSCGVGPVRVNLTSGVSGGLSGVPFDASTGSASLVDGAISVPPLNCSPFLMSTLPMLIRSGALSSLLPAGIDLTDLLGGIDLGSVLGDLDLGDLSGLDLGGIDLEGLDLAGLVGGLEGITLDLTDPQGSLGSLNSALGLPTTPGTIGVRLNVTITAGPETGGEMIEPGTEVWPLPGFVDVPTGEFFAEPVRWLAAHGITSGVRPGYFDPMSPVTRGQMAAFLWRTMDQPASDTDCGFNDVVEERYFAAAVCWMKENAITNGMGGNTTVFAPDAPVKRSEMALFLWRLTGEQPSDLPSGFRDVASNASFADAVDWLKATRITNGVSSTAFDPAGRVSRGQMAAFLHRMASNGDAWPDSMRLPSAADGELRCLAIGFCPGPTEDNEGPGGPGVPCLAPVGLCPPDGPPGGGDAEPPTTLPDVVGMWTRQAIETLVDAGYAVRVVERDGTSFPVTFDFRLDRVNLAVAGDRVVRASLG